MSTYFNESLAMDRVRELRNEAQKAHRVRRAIRNRRLAAATPPQPRQRCFPNCEHFGAA